MIPSLFIERFIVFRDNLTVYDQVFHEGVNIIRGANSTGKSTVMDLLYYALGGELKEWTNEQELCTHVHVEASLSGRIFCLRRDISETGKAAMTFFEGKTEAALEDSKNWFRYPSRRSEDKHSYSEQLFNLLRLPQHKTESANNLTMHQILRLIYVDQLTDTTKLLNDEKEWDHAITRKAIGEYLLSVDDLEAHKLRQQLIAANKHYEAVNGELTAIIKVLRREEQVFQIEQIKNDLNETFREISDLEEQRQTVQNRKFDDLEEEVREKSVRISEELRKLSEEIEILAQSKSSATSERLDILAFETSIRERLTSLEHSTITNEEFGEVGFDYCPSCLSELKEDVDEGHCKLCGSEHSSETRQYAYLQLINELQFQLRESESLLPELDAEINRANAKIPKIERNIDQLKGEYRTLTENAVSVEAILYDIASQIGFYKGQVENLQEKLEFAERIEELRGEKARANEQVNKIRDKLAEIEASQEQRRVTTYSEIEETAKSLIVGDGGYEESFEAPEEVSFDFAKNKMFVNGRSKFSASSMVIMKNSIRAAIFVQSLKDKKVRFPRLLLNDNMEDKGMTPERSQNFQRNLVEICSDQDSPYQLIFTTSMIAQELEDDRYVAGLFYKKGDHTLNFSPKRNTA